MTVAHISLKFTSRNWLSSQSLKAAIAVFGLFCLFTAGGLRAQTAEQFFVGRSLTLLLGGGAGGSVDIYGRLVAQHIVRQLPGSPTVVVRNLPAAGGIQAYMALANTAPKDGSTFATFARGPLTDPIFDDKPANYDVRKFKWLGSLNDDTSLCYTLGPSSIKTLDDAQKHEVTMASTGATSESGKFPLALNATIGTRFKVINGYSGVANTMLAIEAGETDGRCTTLGNLKSTRPEYLQPGKLNILVQIGLKKTSEFGNAPLASELASSGVARELLNFIAAPIAIDAPFALPEGVPEDIQQIWQQAFSKMISDPEFLNDAKKLNFDVRPHSGEEVTEIIRKIYSLSPVAREFGRKAFSVGK